MLDFAKIIDKKTGKPVIKTSITGKHLLALPQLNKGTAFTQSEREVFGLLGKLPHRIETLDEQVTRAYLQLSQYTTPLQKNIYLNNLHDKNHILFYQLLAQHLEELIPIIYTPTVGQAVQAFSREYRQPRGLYISHTYQEDLETILKNRSNPDIDLIVVTDGEGVLGIGDQGIGGMDIPVAKLMVYSACGGIDPSRTLPIFLDVGTNNVALLDDPLYLGCRHNRIYADEYDKFMDKFIHSIQKYFPHAFLHWEDFGRNNASRILLKYQHQLCSFNDDIQGTGATTLAALLAAADATDLPLIQHRFVIYGAGSAGMGVSDQIVAALVRLGLRREEAYHRFCLVDRQGLLIDTDPNLTPAQKPYARKHVEFQHWNTTDKTQLTLADTVKAFRPTILIGCSAQPGHFTQEIITHMASYCERPIIFPLSNPDQKCEAKPFDILTWTQGKALVATGTAFDMVRLENRVFTIAQCNNALIFPGIGLGVLTVQAKQVNEAMLWAAAEALSELAPIREDHFLPLLPSLCDAEQISKKVALAVARAAIASKVARKHPKNLENLIEDSYWKPDYLPFKK
ncbi:MAG: NAD-dependent malic enzyme [Legionellaceae bacterium]|nr:NAD-dependent malic enzyme [Legionellaceae bacterium]MBP9775679.1 NAD-dependent malic enzyme [Legionellaceae bacterium]